MTPKMEKSKNLVVRTTSLILGIFCKSAVLLLGPGKSKISSMYLCTPNLMASLRDTYRSQKNEIPRPSGPLADFWEFSENLLRFFFLGLYKTKITHMSVGTPNLMASLRNTSEVKKIKYSGCSEFLGIFQKLKSGPDSLGISFFNSGSISRGRHQV